MMKKISFIAVLLVLFCSTVYAVEFSPTLLKVTADPVIQYDFDGSEIRIPVQVSGKPAGMIFCVFTKDQKDNIAPVKNGFLGWHYVNKIDTCIYHSPLQSVQIGGTEIIWTGKDQDGGEVPPGDYTYYIWAFDNMSPKEEVCYTWLGQNFQEYDVDGLPMAQPILYSRTSRWVVGGDAKDESLRQTTDLAQLPAGWNLPGLCGITGENPEIDPFDHNYFYVHAENAESGACCIMKFKWVPAGEAELQTDFGEDGYGGLFNAAIGGTEPGVDTDGDYLYTGDDNHTDTNEPDADIYIVDFDGYMVEEIDVSEWWSDPDELELGGQMNGGPSTYQERNGMLFLNCHCSCLVQMVDPTAFLESGDTDDFYRWSNDNGDYTLDHNFEDTAQLKWVCNDYNVGPYVYSVSADNEMFSALNAYDVGAVSFGLIAPDGTGLVYLGYAGETAGQKRMTMFVDCGGSYDGIYCDDKQSQGPHYERTPEDTWVDGTFFVGHDAISGTITSAVGVEEQAPVAFQVSQNAPNPFNPTTTISFSLAEAGDVSVDVFNVAGQKIDTLVDGFMDAGSQSVVWDASNFSAGIYFYTVKSGDHSKTIKMTLIK